MLVLVVGSGEKRLDDIAAALRREGLTAVIAPSAGQAFQLVTALDPSLALFVGSSALDDRLLDRIDSAEIPVVVVADVAARGKIAKLRAPAALLVESTSSEEIAAAAVAFAPRRRFVDEPSALECGPLFLDLEQQAVSLHGNRIEMPPKEFAILRELVLEAGRPVSSEDLIRRVWPDNGGITAGDVHGHVYRLRSIIGDHDRPEPLIVNRRGFGYAVAAPVRVQGDGDARTRSVS